MRGEVDSATLCSTTFSNCRTLPGQGAATCREEYDGRYRQRRKFTHCRVQIRALIAEREIQVQERAEPECRQQEVCSEQ